MKNVLCLLLMGVLSACQPSKITQSWTDKNAAPRFYNKILVLGILTESERELEMKMEDHLAGDLRELGYRAETANRAFPPGTFVKGDTARAAALIIGQGFDAVLTIALLDKKQEAFYVPGRITDYSSPGTYNHFDLYFNTVSEKIYAPGYYGEETRYIWQNNFYDFHSRKLVYIAHSSTFDIASANALAHDYGQLMAGSLVDKNILLKAGSGKE